jgi:hypothetical protein
LTCTQGTRRDASSVFQPKELRQPFHTRRYISQGWRTRYSHIPSERSEHSERPAGSHGDASLRHRELRPEPAGKRHKAWLHLPATLSRSLATPSEQAQITVLPGCEPESPRGSPPSGGRAARAPLGTCQAASATLAGQQADTRVGASSFAAVPNPAKSYEGQFTDSTEVSRVRRPARAGGRPWPPRTGEGLPALTLQAHTLDATAARIVPHAAGRPRCDLLAQRDGRPTHSRASGAVQVQPRADASQHRWQDPADGGREPESSHNPYSGCTLRGRAPASW